MDEPPIHKRYYRLFTAYVALCARLSIEPIPGHLLDRRLLGREFVRLYGLALDADIYVEDIIDEALV